jgi:hypothetical protein
MDDTRGSFNDWAVLELMGHRKLAGKVTEQTIAGVGLIRIDIPNGDTRTTQFYHPNALYCLTPCSEEVVRAFAKQAQPEPVTRWELPGIEPQQRPDHRYQHDSNGNDDDGEEDPF